MEFSKFFKSYKAVEGKRSVKICTAQRESVGILEVETVAATDFDLVPFVQYERGYDAAVVHDLDLPVFSEGTLRYGDAGTLNGFVSFFGNYTEQRKTFQNGADTDGSTQREHHGIPRKQKYRDANEQAQYADQHGKQQLPLQRDRSVFDFIHDGIRSFQK